MSTQTHIETYATLRARRDATETPSGVLVGVSVALGEDVLNANPGEIQLAAALTHHWEVMEFSNTASEDAADSIDAILDEIAVALDA